MPTTLTGLLLFIAVLAPGLAYVVVRERDIPKERLSPFRETATVAVVSAISLTAVVVPLLAVVSAFRPPGGIDGQITRVAASHSATVFWSAGILATASLGSVIFAKAARSRTPRDLSKMSSWWVLFDQWPREFGNGSVPHVSCWLDDGSWIEGRLGTYSDLADDSQDRDLVLVDPIKYSSGEEDPAAHNVHAICISARRIASMCVSYVPTSYYEQMDGSTSSSEASASQQEVSASS